MRYVSTSVRILVLSVLQSVVKSYVLDLSGGAVKDGCEDGDAFTNGAFRVYIVNHSIDDAAPCTCYITGENMTVSVFHNFTSITCHNVTILDIGSSACFEDITNTTVNANINRTGHYLSILNDIVRSKKGYNGTVISVHGSGISPINCAGNVLGDTWSRALLATKPSLGAINVPAIVVPVTLGLIGLFTILVITCMSSCRSVDKKRNSSSAQIGDDCEMKIL